MKNANSLLYSFILLVGDFVALVLAFTFAFVIRVKLDDRPLLQPLTAVGYMGVVAILLVFWLVIFAIIGLYRSQVYDNRFKEFLLLVVGSFIGILFLIGSEYALNRAIFPARLVTVYGFIFALLLTLLFRTLARATSRFLYRFNIGVNDVLLVGATDITNELIGPLNDMNSGFRLAGIVGDQRFKYLNPDNIPQYSNFVEATKAIDLDSINSIVQTELFADDYKNDEILAFAQENHIAYRFIPTNNRLFVGNIEVSLFENIPTIAVHQTALTGWGRVAKRLFDIFASVVLIILTSPILILTWLIISTVGGGRPVYRQTRLSRFDAKIGLLKFRSHKTEFSGGLTPEQVFTKMGKPELAKEYRQNGDYLENDPRVSKIGKFLRRTSIDELPQLFNVLKGNISLVGPRPLIPQEMNQFHKKSVILSVKPGLTGLAVVAGRRDIDFEERRKLDTYYVQNWSFWLDIVILLQTVIVVFRRSGAK